MARIINRIMTRSASPGTSGSRHSCDDFVKPGVENIFASGVSHMASISSREQIFVDSPASDYEIVFDRKD